MALQIKIFSSAHINIDGLENQVNNWLAEHTNCLVQDIKVSFSENHIIMTLLYQNDRLPVRNTQAQKPQDVSRQMPIVATRPASLMEQTKAPAYPKAEQKLPINIGTTNISQINSISPSSVKPANNFVQKNYNKYNSSAGVSEDEAFDWN